MDVLMILVRLVSALILIPVCVAGAAFLTFFGGLAWIATGTPFKAYVTYPRWR